MKGREGPKVSGKKSTENKNGDDYEEGDCGKGREKIASPTSQGSSDVFDDGESGDKSPQGTSSLNVPEGTVVVEIGDEKIDLSRDTPIESPKEIPHG